MSPRRRNFGGMNQTFKRIFAAGVLTGFGVLGISVAGISGAAISSAGDMNINATGGAGTAVDKDGTQGNIKAAVQGTQDDDNDQDAWLHPSTDVTPQFKAK